jgi:hypothetical protein
MWQSTYGMCSKAGESTKRESLSCGGIKRVWIFRLFIWNSPSSILCPVTYGTLSSNVWRIFEHLRDKFSSARVVDPANTNNIISDDLKIAERGKIKAMAEQALSAKDWSQIVK